MPRPTTRHFQAYLYLRHRPVGDGMTFNDNYNLSAFDIDRATYGRIHAAVVGRFGLMASGEVLTVAVLRKMMPQ